MIRTQISLTEDERRLLDEVAVRTGRSMSALIRDAIHSAYDFPASPERDLAVMASAFGAWADRDVDGEAWVEQVRSGRRLTR